MILKRLLTKTVFTSPFLFAPKHWMVKGRLLRGWIAPFRTPLYKNAVFITHSAKGFDSYLLLNAIIEQGLKPSLIMQGSKVICFTDLESQQKYIGSLSCLYTRLATMPAALGLVDFPHSFTSKARFKYVGPYPLPQSYGGRSGHKTVRGGTFDFQKDAL